MTTITILGAGAMGSAIATPLVDAGHQVRLWGTHLDDHLIAAIRAHEPHPRTKVPVPEQVETYLSPDLEEALAGADFAILAVASGGVADVTRLAAPHLGSVKGIMLTSKGFAPDAEGRMLLLPQAMIEQLTPFGLAELPIVAVGGPCKANEVGARRPTAPIYAAVDNAEFWAALVSTATYRAAHTSDRDGVELCAALKNVFAISLGVADGLGESGEPFHDLKSAAFAQAVAELRLVLEAEGCDPWTAAGLAGAGDLEVTGLSGRNKVYGTRLGRGQEARVALAEMEALEQTVEGVSAAKLAQVFVEQRHPELLAQLPLLRSVFQVVHEDAPLDRIIEAALPR